MAFAAKPTAVELTPVAAVAVQGAASKVPPGPEKHCASAGAAPKPVTIPAAASERKAPPAMALAPSRRARRLPTIEIG